MKQDRSTKKKKVALVDNDQDLEGLFTEICKNLDLNCYYSPSGSPAIKYFLENYVDLMIVDLGIADMSGFNVIRVVRRNEKTFQLDPTRIIVYTGYDMHSEVGERVHWMLQQLIDRKEIERVVVKPYDLGTLIKESLNV